MEQCSMLIEECSSRGHFDAVVNQDRRLLLRMLPAMRELNGSQQKADTMNVISRG